MAFSLILPGIARFEGFSLDLWMAPLSPFGPRLMTLTDLPRTQSKDLRCLYLLDYPLLDLINDVQLPSFSFPCPGVFSYPPALLRKEHNHHSKGQP